MAEKYSNEQLRRIIFDEGLDYTFTGYLSPKDIEDKYVKDAVVSYLLARDKIRKLLDLNEFDL